MTEENSNAEQHAEALRRANEELVALEERLRRLGDTGLAAADGLQEVSRQSSLAAEAERKAEEAKAVKNRVITELANTAIRTTQNVINALESTEKSFKKYNAAIDAATDGISGIASQFGLMGKVLGGTIQALGALQKEVNIYRDAVVSLRDATFKSGAGMSATGEQMKALAKEAGFTYHNMEKLNSTFKGMDGTFRIFLGGADSAGEAFMKMTKVTEKQRAEFSRLGIGFEELMEMQAGYAKQLAASGATLSKMNIQTGLQTTISQRYVKDLLIMAEMTGQSVEAQQRQMETQQAVEAERIYQAQQNAKISKLEREAKEAERKGDTEKATALKEEVAVLRTRKELEDKFIAQRTQGMTEQQRAGYISTLRSGGDITTTIGAEAVLAASYGERSIADESAYLNRQLSDEDLLRVVRAGGKDSEEGGAIFNKLADEAQMQGATGAEMAKRGQGEMLMSMGQAVPQALGEAGLESLGLGIKPQELTQDRREALQEARDDQATAVQLGISAIADEEVTRQEREIYMRRGMDSMVASLADHKKALNALTIATGVLTAAFVAYKVAGMFRGGVPGSVPGGGLPGAAAGGLGRLASLGPALSGLGKGLGEGIAGFFAAFGNAGAAVVKGAAYLAGIIALLGGGISIAIAALSLSLPMFARSIQKFEELDGEKLKAVGKGVVALGAGLVAFGGGALIGGIGNAVNEAIGWVTKLVGGKDIIGKLREFSNLNIKVDDFKAKAEALQIYAKAMATLGKAKGSVFSRKVDFSGPIKGMEQLSKAQINVENIEKYTPALEMFIKAINRFQPPKTGIVDGLLAAFGKEKKIVLPMDSFKEFITDISGLDADPEKINAFTGALGVYIQGLAKLEGMKPSAGAMKIATGNIDAKGFVKFLSDLGSEGANIDVKQFKGTMEMFKAFTSALSGMDSIAKAEDFDFEDVAEDIVDGLDEFDVGLDDKTIKANIETAKTFLAVLKDFGSVSDLKALEKFDYENVAEEMIYALRELSDDDDIDKTKIDANIPLIKQFMGTLKELEGIGLPSEELAKYPYEDLVNNIMNGIVDVGNPDGLNPQPELFNKNVPLIKQFLYTIKEFEGIGLPSKELAFYPYEDLVNNIMNGIVDVGDPDGLNPEPELFNKNVPLIKQFLYTLKEFEGIGLPSKELAFYPYEDLVNNIMNGIVDVGDPDGLNPEPELFNKNVPLIKQFLYTLKEFEVIGLPSEDLADWPYETFVEGVMEGIDEVDDNSINENRFDKNLTYMDKFFKFWTSVKWQELTSSVKNLKDFKIPDNVYKEFERLDRLALKQKIIELIEKASDFISPAGRTGGGGTSAGAAPSAGAPSRGSSTRRRSSAASTPGAPPGGGVSVGSGSDMTAKGGDPDDQLEGKVGGGGGDPKDATKGEASAAHGTRKSTKGLILHHTGGRSVAGAIKTLQARGLGYHYLIDRDGTITNYVDDSQVAWHAGEGDKVQGLSNANTIGISLSAKDDKDVTKEQLQAGFDLGQQLMSKYGISSIYGHGEYSKRKHPEEGLTLANALRSGKISAREGGVVDGPTTGFPAVLHGREQIVPLGNNSLLEKLGQTSADTLNAVTNTSTTNTNSNEDMVRAMINRLDEVIYKLEESNDIQDKILKYNMT